MVAKKAIIGYPDCDPEDIPPLEGDELAVFERFAALVAEKEREECAMVCMIEIGGMGDGYDCAAAVRKRGQK